MLVPSSIIHSSPTNPAGESDVHVFSIMLIILSDSKNPTKLLPPCPVNSILAGGEMEIVSAPSPTSNAAISVNVVTVVVTVLASVVDVVTSGIVTVDVNEGSTRVPFQLEGPVSVVESANVILLVELEEDPDPLTKGANVTLNVFTISTVGLVGSVVSSKWTRAAAAAFRRGFLVQRADILAALENRDRR